MNLNEWQIEILKETFNIGVGQAASALSELANNQLQVELTVPQVMLLPPDRLLDAVNEVSGDNICAVSQSYSGPFEGVAVMLYSEEASLQLVSILLGTDFPVDRMTEIETDALCEVGNIILNSCLGAIGSLLGKEIETGLPMISRGKPQDVLTAKSEFSGQVVYLKMGFNIATMNLSGHISFLLEPEKISNLIKCLEEYYSVVL